MTGGTRPTLQGVELQRQRAHELVGDDRVDSILDGCAAIAGSLTRVDTERLRDTYLTLREQRAAIAAGSASSARRGGTHEQRSTIRRGPLAVESASGALSGSMCGFSFRKRPLRSDRCVGWLVPVIR